MPMKVPIFLMLSLDVSGKSKIEVCYDVEHQAIILTCTRNV